MTTRPLRCQASRIQAPLLQNNMFHAALTSNKEPQPERSGHTVCSISHLNDLQVINNLSEKARFVVI